MLFFRKKYAIATTRSLNKKIKKINKIRNNYIDFCNVITNDTEAFTEVMKDVHDKMIDVVKESKQVAEDFEDVYRKYSDDEDDDTTPPGSIEMTDDEFIRMFTESDDEDDDEDNIEDEDDIEDDECDECCNDEEGDEEEEPTSINVSDIEMKNFPKNSSPIIAATAFMIHDRVTATGFVESFEKAGLETVSKDEKTFTVKGRGVSAVITHDGEDNVENVEIKTRIPVIPHSDPCKKIYNDISIDGFLPIISGTKPFGFAEGDVESNWYFCDIEEGTDPTNEDDNILVLNVEVNKRTKAVTLRYLYSDSIPHGDIMKFIKKSNNKKQNNTADN